MWESLAVMTQRTLGNFRQLTGGFKENNNNVL